MASLHRQGVPGAGPSCLEHALSRRLIVPGSCVCQLSHPLFSFPAAHRGSVQKCDRGPAPTWGGAPLRPDRPRVASPKHTPHDAVFDAGDGAAGEQEAEKKNFDQNKSSISLTIASLVYPFFPMLALIICRKTANLPKPTTAACTSLSSGRATTRMRWTSLPSCRSWPPWSTASEWLRAAVRRAGKGFSLTGDEQVICNTSNEGAALILTCLIVARTTIASTSIPTPSWIGLATSPT